LAEKRVHIGEVLVHGVLFDPKNTEAWRAMDVEGLYRAAPRLFDLLDERGVEYVLVGGIAMLAYVDGRNTQDIDLILSAADLAKVPELRLEDQNAEFARARFGELQIDLLFSEKKLFDLVRRKFTAVIPFAEHDVRCATVEGLLLLKLFALPSLYRQGRFDKVRAYEKDVADLLERYRPEMAPLLKELDQHLSASDAEEVRRIVAEIDERLERQSERFRGD
jgi:hypothetical protein